MSVQHIIDRLYPYNVFLGKEGKTAVKDTLKVSIAHMCYNSREWWILTVVFLTNVTSLLLFKKEILSKLNGYIIADAKTVF